MARGPELAGMQQMQVELRNTPLAIPAVDGLHLGAYGPGRRGLPCQSCALLSKSDLLGDLWGEHRRHAHLGGGGDRSHGPRKHGGRRSRRRRSVLLGRLGQHLFCQLDHLHSCAISVTCAWRRIPIHYVNRKGKPRLCQAVVDAAIFDIFWVAQQQRFHL